ncbi:MAG: ABC transporter permease [Anaerolineae bacterium]|jgi:ABC-2 type transport system permease protein|nr:ABC transporter permease [Anaerolineae bacterium]
MNTIINIARLHITLQLQNRSTYLQSFIVPIAMMFILGIAISGQSPVLHLDIVDEDQTERSAEFIQAIRDAEGDTLVEVCLYGSEKNAESCDLEDDAAYEKVGEDRIKEGSTTAILMIPVGFGAALEAGESVALIYQSNDQFNAPTITRTAVETAISEVGGSALIARIGVETAEEFFGGSSTSDLPELQTEARAGLQNPPAQLVTKSTGKNPNQVFGASQSVPGIGTMFVLFSLTGLAINLVLEREQGTLQRLFTLPAPKSYIVIGKVLGAFFFGVIQFTVFVVVGILMKVDWGSNYLAIALVVLAYCFAGTALGFAMATLVRTSNQAGGISTLIVLTLAPLGGAWWPLEIVPESMQTVGHLSPIAWAMDGFGDIIYDGGGVMDVLPEVGVLLLMAGVLLVFSVWRFRYE